MTASTEFKSRRGILECKAADAFRFVTDMRNFRQFIHGIRVDDLKIDSESCSFYISPVGEVKMKISGKVPEKEVFYVGSVLKSNDFSLLLEMNDNMAGKAEISLTARADLNPVLMMMASKPVEQFLESLIGEMEKFRNWHDVIK